jgi:hypothetical protein
LVKFNSEYDISRNCVFCLWNSCNLVRCTYIRVNAGAVSTASGCAGLPGPDPTCRGIVWLLRRLSGRRREAICSVRSDKLDTSLCSGFPFSPFSGGTSFGQNPYIDLVGATQAAAHWSVSSLEALVVELGLHLEFRSFGSLSGRWWRLRRNLLGDIIFESPYWLLDHVITTVDVGTTVPSR